MTGDMQGSDLSPERKRRLLWVLSLSSSRRMLDSNISAVALPTIAIGYDGFIFGLLGPHALAGIALVFSSSC